MAGIQALIAGTQKHFANGSLTFGNATHTASSLIQTLQDLVNAMTAYAAAQATTKDAQLALHTVEVTADPIVSAYRKFLDATFGNATQTLADFGLTPTKARAPLTVEAKSAMVALGAATRLARGTKGKKQLAKIRGTVPATTSEQPVPPPAAPPKAAT